MGFFSDHILSVCLSVRLHTTYSSFSRTSETCRKASGKQNIRNCPLTAKLHQKSNACNVTCNCGHQFKEVACLKYYMACPGFKDTYRDSTGHFYFFLNLEDYNETKGHVQVISL